MLHNELTKRISYLPQTRPAPHRSLRFLFSILFVFLPVFVRMRCILENEAGF